MPAPSFAEAVTVVVPERVAPADGAVIETVGLVGSAAASFTRTTEPTDGTPFVSTRKSR